jgi:hypothetical protein
MRRRDMSGVIDGAFDSPDGRKLYVSLRPEESSDAFVTRAMSFMYAMGDGHALDKVLASTPSQWEVVPSNRWIEAVNSSEPRLRLRVTDLSFSDGSSVGHLVVECGGDQIADDWGDLLVELVYLPRTRHGRVWTWQATLWSLVHEIHGLGDQYGESFERSGVIVEGGA